MSYRNDTVVISDTYINIKDLKDNGNLTIGTIYEINDLTDIIIFLEAISENDFKNECTLITRVVRKEWYVNGFGRIGIWDPTLSIPLLWKAVWGGRVWSNLTGSIGTSLNQYTLDSTNWAVEPITDDIFYEDYPLKAVYDFDDNFIHSVEDLRGNKFYYIDNNTNFLLSDYNDYTINISNNIIYNNNISPVYNILNNLVDSLIYFNVIKGPIYSNKVIIIRDNSNLGEISQNTNAGEIVNNSNLGEITLNSNNGFISTNSNIGSISLNSNDGAILSNNNFGQIFNNSNNDTISNNSNIGNINGNTNMGSIFTNSNRGNINLNSNIGDILFNNNNGNVNNNQNLSFILNNQNLGQILNNQSGGFIANNSNSGPISNNQNTGNIERNSNNGSISNVDNTVVNIYSNINNGNITVTGGGGLDVTDTVVNKS